MKHLRPSNEASEYSYFVHLRKIPKYIYNYTIMQYAPISNECIINQNFLCFNRGKFSFTKTHELNLSSKAVKKFSNAQRILAISTNSLLN